MILSFDPQKKTCAKCGLDYTSKTQHSNEMLEVYHLVVDDRQIYFDRNSKCPLFRTIIFAYCV